MIKEREQREAREEAKERGSLLFLTL